MVKKDMVIFLVRGRVRGIIGTRRACFHVVRYRPLFIGGRGGGSQNGGT